jgi:cytochrome c oxidase subunit IV
MPEHKQGIVTYLIVYALILVLAFMQFIFAYQMGAQLSLMLMLAMIQATLAVLFFMNLKQERTTLILALIPALLFVLFQLNMIWSDSFRLLLMRPFSK